MDGKRGKEKDKRKCLGFFKEMEQVYVTRLLESPFFSFHLLSYEVQMLLKTKKKK